MEKVIKLDNEDVQPLLELENRWTELVKRAGELHYQQRSLTAELAMTNAEFDQLDEDRFSVIQRLQEKYGQGQINLATGEFYPDPLTTT